MNIQNNAKQIEKNMPELFKLVEVEMKRFEREGRDIENIKIADFKDVVNVMCRRQLKRGYSDDSKRFLRVST